jgi:hypothetical protein
MDNQTLSVEVFLKSLTEVQADTCERDEKQLTGLFKAGWSEENAVCFHRAMLHARRVNPTITVEGVFEAAFRLGLSFIGDESVLTRLNQAREDDVIVYGIERKDGKDAGRTACTVSPDVAALAKLRRRTAQRERQQTDRQRQQRRREPVRGV